MADEDQSAVVIGKALLENFESLHVQVIGRFVEDQQVCGLRKQLCENDPISLAPRECFHRHRRSLWRKQKSLQIADDVPVLAIQFYISAAASDVVRDRFLLIERFAHLVEITDLEICSVFDRSGLRFELAQQQAE